MEGDHCGFWGSVGLGSNPASITPQRGHACVHSSGASPFLHIVFSLKNFFKNI